MKFITPHFFLIQILACTIGLLAGFFGIHHHPHIWHAGDTLPSNMTSIDFGIYQLLTAGCNEEKDRSDFHSLVHYGRHALHHMFPTIDHKLLYHFDNALIETCREFNVLDVAPRSVDDSSQTRWSKGRQLTLWEGIIGAFEIVSNLYVLKRVLS